MNSLLNRLSVQSKLLLTVLVASLLSLVLTGLLSFVTSRQALTNANFNQLEATRNSSAMAITEYFDNIHHQVLTLSEAKMVVSAINEFKPAVAKLANSTLAPVQIQKIKDYYEKTFIPELKNHIGGNPLAATYLPQTPTASYLRYYYTVANPLQDNRAKLEDAKDGSEYSKIHKDYNYRFRRIAEEFGYEDIYLIDIESGRVLYSMAKEADFATDLINGPFSDSNLARIFQEIRKSRDPNFVTMVDFEAYKGSYGHPSAFIGTTVFDGDKFTGALVFQVLPTEVNRIMTANQNWEKVGMGRTGEAFLVGQDNAIRSNPRLFVENPDAFYQVLQEQGTPLDQIALMKRANSPILIQKIKTEAAQKALDGKTGQISYKDFRGKQVLGSFQPIKLNSFEWGLVAKKDKEELFQGIDRLSRYLLGLAAVLIPLITLLAMRLARNFSRPIQRLIDGTRAIAAGDVDVQVEVQSKDEFGQLTTSFNQMAKSLKEKDQAIQAQIHENDRLLLSILPPMAAERLKSGERDIAESYPSVTFLYADMEGFNNISSQLQPEETIVLLNELIGAFDEAADRHGVEKLRGVGSTYLAVCGLSVPRVDHAKRTVDFALELLQIIRRLSEKQGLILGLDIGIHSGALAAGVVGKNNFYYEVWGETMNIARTIHESPKLNVILVTDVVAHALQGLYRFDPAGEVNVKGKGVMNVWEVSSLQQLTSPTGDR